MKFRATLNPEACNSHEYKDKIIYFTLDDLMRGKICISYPEHWIISRFTGLLDINQEEIYEGDLVRHVKCCHKHDGSMETSKVVYDGIKLLPFGDELQGSTYQESRNYEIVR